VGQVIRLECCQLLVVECRQLHCSVFTVQQSAIACVRARGPRFSCDCPQPESFLPGPAQLVGFDVDAPSARERLLHHLHLRTSPGLIFVCFCLSGLLPHFAG
jgi:hypothetical protein